MQNDLFAIEQEFIDTIICDRIDIANKFRSETEEYQANRERIIKLEENFTSCLDSFPSSVTQTFRAYINAIELDECAANEWFYKAGFKDAMKLIKTLKLSIL